MTGDQIRELAGVLAQTRPDELTCDEWLAEVGAYAEALAHDAPPPSGSERVAHHVALCPECSEELQALVAALRGGA